MADEDLTPRKRKRLDLNELAHKLVRKATDADNDAPKRSEAPNEDATSQRHDSPEQADGR